ncbi:white collar 2 type of transcription factor [Saitoella coloradoensis]
MDPRAQQQYMQSDFAPLDVNFMALNSPGSYQTSTMPPQQQFQRQPSYPQISPQQSGRAGYGQQAAAGLPQGLMPLSLNEPAYPGSEHGGMYPPQQQGGQQWQQPRPFLHQRSGSPPNASTANVHQLSHYGGGQQGTPQQGYQQQQQQQQQQGPSSSLTEFTKRKNWSQRIIDEIRDFMHILSPTGTFIYASPSSHDLVGYYPNELIGRPITDFMHVDDMEMFVGEFNNCIKSRKKFSAFYRFRTREDRFAIFETVGHPRFGTSGNKRGDEDDAGDCKCFFMVARPYPTKSAAMLDSFLELKLENERLRKRLRELALPSSAVEAADPRPGTSSPPGQSGDPNALTRQNLEEAERNMPEPLVAGAQSIREKMANYGYDPQVIDTIEQLTGLRYSSNNIPGNPTDQGQGNVSPALITATGEVVQLPPGVSFEPREDILGTGASSGGADIAMGDDSPQRGLKRKKNKKMKLAADEYVCTDCGTTDSPEWRRGPHGAKTLCNACGLRWAKQEKKQQKEGVPMS